MENKLGQPSEQEIIDYFKEQLNCDYDKAKTVAYKFIKGRKNPLKKMFFKKDIDAYIQSFKANTSNYTSAPPLPGECYQHHINEEDEWFKFISKNSRSNEEWTKWINLH